MPQASLRLAFMKIKLPEAALIECEAVSLLRKTSNTSCEVQKIISYAKYGGHVDFQTATT